MAKAAVAKTASKPASKGKSTTKPTTPVARPAIGKDDKALKEDADAEASSPNPAPVAGKKRKSSASSTGAGVKDPEHDPETIANTTKNSKSHSAAPKDAAKITEGVSTRSERDDKPSKSKKAKVHVNKPAVTEEKTTEEVPLPVVVASSSKGKKPSSKKTTTSTATTTAAPEEEDTEMTPIAPSASKPSAPLKSALKSKSKSNKKPAQTDAEFIHGFSSSSDEGESEDEDDSDVDVDMDAGKKEEKQVKAKDLPKVVEGDKTVQEKLEKAKKRSVSIRPRFSSLDSYFFAILRSSRADSVADDFFLLCSTLFFSVGHGVTRSRARKKVYSTSEGSRMDSTRKR